ncbi:unnamed protein product [Rotaria sp. Silwood2]|nr:unnamed protein product [Rotaria sp. Silwood2]
MFCCFLKGIGIIGNYTSIKSLNVFKSLIQCGIMKGDIIKIFTLVRQKDSKDIYEYYLEYFRNDTDFQYSNQASCPNILKRSSWNARPYTNRENLTTLPVTNIVVHALEGLNSIMNDQDCIAQIKGLQDYDMDIENWADIGYNFLLCDDSGDQQQIYTGRGWKFTGAHCISYNKRSLGKNEFLF